jgi:hypothetical protein
MQMKSRRLRWVGHVVHMRKERKVFKVLVGKPKGKRPLGRPRHRWEDGIRLDLGRLAGEVGVEWIKLAQDGDWWWGLVNMVMNLLVMVPYSQLFREELSILSLF